MEQPTLTIVQTEGMGSSIFCVCNNTPLKNHESRSMHGDFLEIDQNTVTKGKRKRNVGSYIKMEGTEAGTSPECKLNPFVLLFVSARTNKRHHHHHDKKNDSALPQEGKKRSLILLNLV